MKTLHDPFQSKTSTGWQYVLRYNFLMSVSIIFLTYEMMIDDIHDSKIHGTNMGPHLGPTGPRWAPCWPHELCYLGWYHPSYNDKNIAWDVHLRQRKYSPGQKYINIRQNMTKLQSHFRINTFRKLSVTCFSVYCCQYSPGVRCPEVICQQLRVMFWMWPNIFLRCIQLIIWWISLSLSIMRHMSSLNSIMYDILYVLFHPLWSQLKHVTAIYVEILFYVTIVDKMTGKHFPHYYLVVRGIHRLSMDFTHKGLIIRSLDMSYEPEQAVKKESSSRWFYTVLLLFDNTVMQLSILVLNTNAIS